ncbi:MAG: lipid-A-disaccharide synthase, partial [Pseudomonadota bacterium]
MSRPLKFFIVTGEHSGDALGGKLMPALRDAIDAPIEFAGLGGSQMMQAGLEPLFALDDVIVMGPVAIAKAYPRLRRRALECVAAAVAADPDLVIIIDAPEFTHPIAKRVRKRRPDIPIVNYVSPSVWAWRPGRAKKMRPYVDHLLALLPFEPDAHERLGGPPCTYVGHPLSEQIDAIKAIDPRPLAERLGISAEDQTIVVLPGSRTSELDQLLGPFRETISQVAKRNADAGLPGPHVLMPSVPRHLDRLTRETQ